MSDACNPPTTSVFNPIRLPPPVLSASGLPKRNLFRLPDPFVVVSLDGVEKFASTTVKKSLNPFWNEHFDMSVFTPPSFLSTPASLKLNRPERCVRLPW